MSISNIVETSFRDICKAARAALVDITYMVASDSEYDVATGVYAPTYDITEIVGAVKMNISVNEHQKYPLRSDSMKLCFLADELGFRAAEVGDRVVIDGHDWLVVGAKTDPTGRVCIIYINKDIA